MCVAELLYGAKDGVFQYDKLISLQSKTADGLVRAPPPADADHAARHNEPQRPCLKPFALHTCRCRHLRAELRPRALYARDAPIERSRR